ncbi:23S rRNA (guanosine(2251)-2'-O)-methyltransferase RlmB [Kiloniella laminariae]|uniref:23S rRNA (guanosine(2251)-2'-O)-methyltransferase RlmB n=1 Tax=Kiloniella laminariae TaxID=454162 RepID=UPI00035C2273|nr:23S rRNA (guanosine(2251)-2'-O)-methyltransferase RlmB [Kiloniella laminariae]
MAKPKKLRKKSPMNRSGKRDNAGAGNLWLYGIHAVLAALGNPQRQIKRFVITHETLARLESELSEIERQTERKVTPDVAGNADLIELLPPGAVHQGVACLASALEEVFIEDVLSEIAQEEIADGKQGKEDWEYIHKGRTVLLVLDQVTDPQNVGAILRSAAAFGARAVITTDRNSAQPTGALAKTASGALEVVPYVAVSNLVRALEQIKEAGFWCYGLAGEGEKTLAEALPENGKIALIMGAEGTGMRRLTREHCDMLVSLPTQDAFGVLNVSSAAAVALYETARGK